MADTMIVNLPDIDCSDCREKRVTVVYWGPLTESKVKHLCGSCMKKRVDNEYIA